MADQGRVLEIERRLNRALREIDSLQATVKGLSQMLPRAWANGGAGGGEAAPLRSYFCRTPDGGVVAATGSWPTLSPTTFTVNVYKVVGGSLVLHTEAKPVSVYWYYKSPADQHKLVPCTPNGDGTFTAVLDSCEVV